MAEYGLTQIIHGHGSHQSLLFVTNPDLMTSSGCRELGLSDHSMIYDVLTEVVERQKSCLRHVRCFRNIEVDTVVEHLKLAPWQVMDSLEDVNCQ